MVRLRHRDGVRWQDILIDDPDVAEDARTAAAGVDNLAAVDGRRAGGRGARAGADPRAGDETKRKPTKPATSRETDRTGAGID